MAMPVSSVHASVPFPGGGWPEWPWHGAILRSFSLADASALLLNKTTCSRGMDKLILYLVRCLIGHLYSQEDAIQRYDDIMNKFLLDVPRRKARYQHSAQK